MVQKCKMFLNENSNGFWKNTYYLDIVDKKGKQHYLRLSNAYHKSLDIAMEIGAIMRGGRKEFYKAIPGKRIIDKLKEWDIL